jgi:hypothetical protein
MNKRDEAAERCWQEWKNARTYEYDSLIRFKERQLAEIQRKKLALEKILREGEHSNCDCISCLPPNY